MSITRFNEWRVVLAPVIEANPDEITDLELAMLQNAGVQATHIWRAMQAWRRSKRDYFNQWPAIREVIWMITLTDTEDTLLRQYEEQP